MRNKYLYITLLAILGITPEMMAQGKIQYAPRLVVNITIDQLRTDYMEAFSPLYGNDGFKRLLQQGMVFNNANYPFSPIDRASATASIATGVTPYYHSIVGEKWLNRETLRPVYCVGDKQTPDELSTSTIGDELKVSTEGKAKVFSISPFDDAAILSAGHAANGAFWIDDSDGRWHQPAYYAAQLPVWLENFNLLHAPAADDKKLTWEPVMELSGTFNYFQHTENDQKPFKHKFSGNNRYSQLKTSGLINSYVTEMAQYCVVQETMGYDRITDYLTVNYYAGTLGHKAMSECQFELQDTYVRLDQELGRLISHIEGKLGAEHVLFVITSTGYSDVESADYEKYRVPTGTFYINRTANLLNMYFGAIWGQGRYIETCTDNQLYINHKLLEQKRVALTDFCQRARDFLLQMEGVKNVYNALQLLSENNSQTAKVRNGFHPQHNGDILIEVNPGWHLQNEETGEDRVSQASAIPFPIILYGADILSEQVNTPVTTDSIAPTLSRAIRIRAPNACSSEPLY